MKRVHIVGGGVAGLSCARHLESGGGDLDLRVTLSEAADVVGGRVRTDVIDGHACDRGFQVFLTSYPEARELLDYDALRLGGFVPGAKVRHGGRFHTVADPLRSPRHLAATALAGVAGVGDKLALAKLWAHVRRLDVDQLVREPQGTTYDYLRSFGLGDAVIERFFRPFYGGVFLEQELTTSCRLFAFTFRMFADGRATLPAGGIGQVPAQLAAGLRRTEVRTGERAGSLPEADAVVVATDANAAADLLGEPGVAVRWHGTTSYHFAADRSPVGGDGRGGFLYLNAEGGVVNNVTVPSDVAAGYAPAGRAQVCASVIGVRPGSEAEVRRELRGWFGSQVDGWRLLRENVIEHALPDQSPPALDDPAPPVRRRPGLYACGDHASTASLNGAMAAGRRAAEALLHDVRVGEI